MSTECCDTSVKLAVKKLLECKLPGLNALEFFTVYTKLAEMAILASTGLSTPKKVTSSGARSDTRYHYWFKSPTPNQLSHWGMCYLGDL